MDMANKTITPATFPAYITKRQGDKNETHFAQEIGIARQIIRRLKKGECAPSVQVLDKLGLEPLYREKEASVSAPAPLATAAKTVTKKAIKAPAKKASKK